MKTRLILAITRATAPLTRRVAQSGLISLWAVVRHRGRRSGKWYATPIAIRPTDDGFVLPLPWGEGTDWCRNLRAAGGGVIVWGGTEYEVTSPEIIDVSDALPAFSKVMRPIVRLTGIKKFLRVRRAVVAKDVSSPIERTA
jgi:deazaflavin-dependent oxidoreductase (nitroreductase family)